MGRRLVQHLDLKVLAVAIAAALWWFVVSTEKTQVALAAPVEYAGLDDERMLVGPRPETVAVEVQALRWMAARLGPDTVRVRVNLAEVRDGATVVEVQPEQVQTPAGVRVTRITPARLVVTVESARRRTVRVTPRIEGVPAPGFTVDRVTVDPPAVQIKGPRSTIDTRQAVDTAPIDVSGSRETVTRTVALALPESVYAMRERAVQVTVEIRAGHQMKRGGGR